MLNKLFRPSSSVSLSATIAGIIVTIIGLAVLVGWQLVSGILKSILPGTVSMKANTEVELIFSGISLYVLKYKLKEI